MTSAPPTFCLAYMNLLSSLFCPTASWNWVKDIWVNMPQPRLSHSMTSTTMLMFIIQQGARLFFFLNASHWFCWFARETKNLRWLNQNKCVFFKWMSRSQIRVQWLVMLFFYFFISPLVSPSQTAFLWNHASKSNNSIEHFAQPHSLWLRTGLHTTHQCD